MQCNIATLDLAARLNGTVCMYDDIPYLIMMDEDDHKSDMIMLYDFLSKVFVQKIKSSDPLFDVATPPLGYLQDKGKVVFIERLPHRQFRQGVTPQVLCHKYFGGQFRVPIHQAAFKDMMMKQYAPLQDILLQVIRGDYYAEYALSNDCALVVDPSGLVKVYFRHDEVAFSSVSELKKEPPVIHVPFSTRAWIIEKYLSKFDWQIVS